VVVKKAPQKRGFLFLSGNAIKFYRHFIATQKKSQKKAPAKVL